MIGTFRHRGLQKLWETSSTAGVQPSHADRLTRLLDQLEAASQPSDMAMPGNRFHPLKGNRAGTYSVTVSGNWRMTFRWKGAEAIDVDLEDYH